MRLLLLTLVIAASGIAAAHENPPAWPTHGWEAHEPAALGLNAARLEEARSYALHAGGAGLITRYGRRASAWGDTDAIYELKSTTKSIGSIALGLAVTDGLLSLSERARLHLPEIRVPHGDDSRSGFIDDITVIQLATHTAGFDRSGAFPALVHPPGEAWRYSDGGVNWLADVLTTAYASDLQEVLFTRVFALLGIERRDLVWRTNINRSPTLRGIERRELGSGISANVDALAKIGYLYLRAGEWDGVRILPVSFVNRATAPHEPAIGLRVLPSSFGDRHAAAHYGLLWWNNANRTIANAPPDTFWAWGLHDSLIVVIPSLDIVATRAGHSGWRDDWNGDAAVLRPFIEAIALAVVDGDAAPQRDTNRPDDPRSSPDQAPPVSPEPTPSEPGLSEVEPVSDALPPVAEPPHPVP